MVSDSRAFAESITLFRFLIKYVVKQIGKTGFIDDGEIGRKLMEHPLGRMWFADDRQHLHPKYNCEMYSWMKLLWLGLYIHQVHQRI